MIDQLKALLQAKDEEKIIQFITDQPQVLDEKDENGSSGILCIAYSGNTKAFETACNFKKSYSFHEAIVCGKKEMVLEILKEDGEHINSLSNDGFSPLSLAAFFNRTNIALTLLKKGSDPGIHASNPSKVNALHSAVARENLELVKAFLKAGINVNANQTHGVTALHSAVHRGNEKLVQLLLDHGANVYATMESGETPMMIAKKEGYEVIYKMLKDYN